MKKIIIFLAIFISLFIYLETSNDIVIIPDTAIRLRVIPNSNSVLDQNIKSKVKEYLEENIYKLLKDETDIDKARNIIKENVSIMYSDINDIFISNNYNMDYKLDYGYNYFPEKEYRGITYEEGYYESIVISIGEAEGDNWWCVLFPNLCLVDLENKEDTEYKSWVIETINKIF